MYPIMAGLAQPAVYYWLLQVSLWRCGEIGRHAGFKMHKMPVKYLNYKDFKHLKLSKVLAVITKVRKVVLNGVVMKLVYMEDSKSSAGNSVPVRVRPTLFKTTFKKYNLATYY